VVIVIDKNLLKEVKKISRVPCGKPKLSVSEKTDAMGHLTRYLLKKAFQLFCFYPNCPKEVG